MVIEKLNTSKVKEFELQMLVEFDNYCKRNNISYFLAYGTLLGAVRHGGFIPWDDDVDVVMPRPDYERFIDMTCKNPINDYMETCTYHKTKRLIPYPFVKILNKNTIVQERYKNKNEKIGIWIDIFPLDGFADDSGINALNIRKELKMQKKLLRALSNPDMVVNPIKRILKKIIVFFLYHNRFIYCKKMDEIAQKYAYQESKSVGVISFGYGLNEQLDKEVFTKREISFEGAKFIVPEKYKEYLSRIYGDYMVLPSPENQIIHEMDAWEIVK